MFVLKLSYQQILQLLKVIRVLGFTVISLLQAQGSIRIIKVHGDGGGPLLEATSARKVCSSNLSIRVAILKC